MPPDEPLATIEQLRAAVAVGLDESDRGLSQTWDPNEIAAEVERKLIDERKSG